MSNILFNNNQDLAYKIAHKCCWDNYYLEDLKQEALLALWEASLEYSDDKEYNFSSAAYYKINSAMRKYRNTFFNVVTIPLQENASKKAYARLVRVLEFSPEVFSTGVEGVDIAAVYRHGIEKVLSQELQDTIRSLKSSIAPSSNYMAVVKRTIDSGPPLSLKDTDLAEESVVSTFALDLNKYRSSLKLFEQCIFDRKILGHSTDAIALIVNQPPRRVQKAWTAMKKEIHKLQ